jgi:hypothetical protein
MIVAGLLSSQGEAQEIQFIANICAVKDRIHFIVRKDAIKRLLAQEDVCDKTKN